MSNNSTSNNNKNGNHKGNHNKTKADFVRKQGKSNKSTSNKENSLDNAVLLSQVEFIKSTTDTPHALYKFSRGQKVRLFDNSTKIVEDETSFTIAVQLDDAIQMNALPGLFSKIKHEVTRRSEFITSSDDRLTHSVESIIYKFLSEKPGCKPMAQKLKVSKIISNNVKVNNGSDSNK